MAKEKETKKEKNERKPIRVKSSSGAVYSLGLLGALVYYLQHATTFWIGVVGVVKAIFWPALLIYKVLDLLKL